MKKSILAITVAAIGFGMGTAHADIYLHADEASSIYMKGRIEGTIASQGDETVNLSKARLGVGAEHQLTDTVAAIGYFEYQFNADDKNNPSYVRDAYMGLKHDNSTIVFGDAGSSMGILTDFTDVMSFHGASAGQKFGATDRTDSNIVYTYTGENLVFKANASLDENKDGGSVAATYLVADGFKVGAGAGHSQGTEQFMASASFTGENAYVGAMGTAKTGDVEYQGYEVAARYKLGKFNTGASYEVGIYDNDQRINGKKPSDISNLTVDGRYEFNPNMTAYVSVVADMEGSDDKAAAGLKYVF